MITPNYRQGCAPEVKDKWYCSYGLKVSGFKERFYRYLSPAGWKKTAHYFETKEEAEETFESFKDYSFYPSREEIQNQRDMEILYLGKYNYRRNSKGILPSWCEE